MENCSNERFGLGAARWALLVVAALAACLALAMRPAPASALEVGFMDPAFASDQPDMFWDDMSELGGSIVRLDAYWADIAKTRPAQPRNPESAGYDWIVLDKLVRDAANHQVKIVMTVWRTPLWARAQKGAAGNSYAFAPNLNDFGAFVFAAATRYSGKFDPDGAEGPEAVLPLVANWEMWNEPNYIGALRPQRTGNKVVSPKIYTGILNRGYKEIAAVEKGQKVKMNVLGGAMNRGFGGKGSVAALVFLRGMKTAGAKFDIATVHPYPPTGVEGLDDGTVAPNITLANFGDYMKELDKLWKPKKYPVWITEFGAQTDPDPNGASYGDQAKFVRQSLKRFATKFPRVKQLIWFMLRDEPLEQRGQSDKWQSGLRDVNLVKKPSYNAWMQTIQSIL